jgi:hypothetical protein
MGTAAEELFMTQIVVSQPPPAANWERTPIRASEPTTGMTVRANGLVAVAAALSVTRAVKLYEPAVVGVPEIVPAPSSVRPPGNAPDVSDQ